MKKNIGLYYGFNPSLFDGMDGLLILIVLGLIVVLRWLFV
jgi:hypothetical protein